MLYLNPCYSEAGYNEVELYVRITSMITLYRTEEDYTLIITKG